jgi:Fe-S-cluster containining protein
MPPGRNDPCPCGSGQKYKRCHGLAAAPAQPDYVAFNRLIAYKGEIGRAREAFCRDYRAAKGAALEQVAENFRQDAAGLKKEISCGKGCAACCHLFIAASLQECEAIVHYLYQHEETLKGFLVSFDSWQARLTRAGRSFHRINSLYRKTIVGHESEAERAAFNAASDEFAALAIPCPFLLDKACSIYEVRPYVCAGVVSLSPPAWCAPDHPEHKQMFYLKSGLRHEYDMPYFVRPAGGLAFANMPALVHDVLTGGYSALASFPGLERLARASEDPEVQAILAACP